MKKYIYSLFMMMMAFAITSCTEDEGSEPGNDGSPKATVYTYNAELPNDPDVDCVLRIAVNNKAKEVYYLAELTTEYEKRLAELGEKGYADYVVSNGTKAEASVDTPADVIVKNLGGANTIVVAAVNGSSKTISTGQFTGYRWLEVSKGTYHSAYSNAAPILGFTEKADVVLQQKETDPTQYRFKDLFGAGQHLVFTKTKMKTEDGGTYVRVAGQATPFTFGNYGTLYVRDVATWQGSDDYLNNVLYDNGYCYLWLQWYVSAGNTGYAYDEFVPNGLMEE